MKLHNSFFNISNFEMLIYTYSNVPNNLGDSNSVVGLPLYENRMVCGPKLYVWGSPELGNSLYNNMAWGKVAGMHGLGSLYPKKKKTNLYNIPICIILESHYPKIQEIW